MSLKRITIATLLLLFLTPVFSYAQWGGTADDWGPDCCGSSTYTKSTKTTNTGDPKDKRERERKPRLACRLNTDKTTINKGEVVKLKVISPKADRATLYKQTGTKRFLFFSSPILKKISDVSINQEFSVTPTKTTTYRARVYGSGYDSGVCIKKITVKNTSTPPANTPSCNITANPSTLTPGGNTTLTWTSSNAVSASIDNSIGSVATSGSYSVGYIMYNTTYTMTVTNSTGASATCKTTVIVNTPPTHTYPSCNVWVTPSKIPYGENATLHWSSNNATSMFIPSIGSLTPNTSGSRTFYNLTSNRTFECRAYDADGHMATDTTQVIVENYSYTAPTCTLFASPISVTAGGDSTLTWNTTNATSVTLSGVGAVPLNGSKVIYNLPTTATYTLIATGPGGTATCKRTINVSKPPQPPIVPPTKVRPSCQIYPIYISKDVTTGTGGAILTWTAQNAARAILTDHGEVNRVTGTQFVKPTSTKTYTLTVFNDGYRASCSTTIKVANHTITDYDPKGKVTLTSVPYTGVEDYISVILLLLVTLTLGFIAFFYRDHIRQAVAPKR